MMLPKRIKHAIEVADCFRSLTKVDDTTSCSIAHSLLDLVVFHLELPIVFVPHLTPKSSYEYLCSFYSSNIPVNEGELDDRSLFGLLHIGPPENIILLQEGLPEHIENFVVAHEIGHFLADVFIVKELWLKLMPAKADAIKNLFNWNSHDPGIELEALIKGLPRLPSSIVGRGQHLQSDTSGSEIQADAVAREIIAPWRIVSEQYRPNDRHRMVEVLRKDFGLPRKIAWYYYDELDSVLAPRIDPVKKIFQTLLTEKREEFR